jgi:hypothetical protein
MPTKVTPGSGAIFSPNFNDNFGITSIDIIDGGTGYASTNPPKIEITGTKVPVVEGVFYPIIANGQIKKNFSFRTRGWLSSRNKYCRRENRNKNYSKCRKFINCS